LELFQNVIGVRFFLRHSVVTSSYRVDIPNQQPFRPVESRSRARENILVGPPWGENF